MGTKPDVRVTRDEKLMGTRFFAKVHDALAMPEYAEALRRAAREAGAKFAEGLFVMRNKLTGSVCACWWEEPGRVFRPVMMFDELHPPDPRSQIPDMMKSAEEISKYVAKQLRSFDDEEKKLHAEESEIAEERYKHQLKKSDGRDWIPMPYAGDKPDDADLEVTDRIATATRTQVRKKE